MSWTDERVERLKKLWNEGLSASQIAADLGGVTRNAVIGKVHRLGLSGRAKSPTRPLKLELIELTEITCKWPIGDPAHDDFHFCGHKCKDGSPYCAYHVSLAYQPLAERRRDRRPAAAAG